MDVVTAVLTRRSHRLLTVPAPSEEEFLYLLRVAATSPDHGHLRPWRWITIRGAARRRLGESFAGELPGRQRERSVQKALRAPLLATLVFCPRTGHRVPRWEQLAATSAMTQTLILLLHSRGFGSIWRTGQAVQNPAVRTMLGLSATEELLGWLYVGTPQVQQQERRGLADIQERLTTLSAVAERERNSITA
ncbi:nitroreductase family protein [Streptomyces sp. LZ34]